jgi:uncharacterized protein (DUF433 family)
MAQIIEVNPEICGGKPIIKGTRIPVKIIYDLVSLDYSIDQIIEEYPTLNREIILEVLKVGSTAQESLRDMDLRTYLERELVQS